MAPPRYTIGWVYNLKTPPKSTNADQIIAIACAFSVLALISVALRFAQRWKIVKAFGVDDFAAAASMVRNSTGRDPKPLLEITNMIMFCSFLGSATVHLQYTVSERSIWKQT